MTKPHLLRDIKPNTIQASIRGKLVRVEEKPIYNPVLKSDFKLLIFQDEQGEYRIHFQLYESPASEDVYRNAQEMIGCTFLIENVYAVVRNEHLEIRSEPFHVEKLQGNDDKSQDFNEDANGINLSSFHYRQVFLDRDPLAL